jgi:hypothetical protein
VRAVGLKVQDKLSEYVAALLREGLLRPPLVPRGTVPPRKPVAPTEELLDELASDREDR